MFYQSEVLFPGLTRIWDVARTAMYLVEGAEKAVLLDTGVGVGDLKELVDGLADNPVTVLVTHGHVDHAMGAAGFRDVRISPLDAEVYREHCSFEGRRGYVLGCAEHGSDPERIRAISDDVFMEPLWNRRVREENGSQELLPYRWKRGKYHLQPGADLRRSGCRRLL